MCFQNHIARLQLKLDLVCYSFFFFGPLYYFSDIGGISNSTTISVSFLKQHYNSGLLLLVSFLKDIS